MRIEKSTCRICGGFCPINVSIENGRVLKVEGDRDAPLYEGFICPKGTALASLHNNLDRLKHHLKRMPDGSYREISSAQLVEEVSAKLKSIIDMHGSHSVAAFTGGPICDQQSMAPIINSFLAAIGSKSFYSDGTIDQPGHLIADALHGTWAGGHPHPDHMEALVLVGTNPIISKQYFGQNPGAALKRLVKRGMKLIVIDPRRTESARHAHVFLQCIPGEDPTILAGLIHCLIRGGAINREFVSRNAEGMERLAEAVAAFTPAYVSERAGIAQEQLLEAARILGAAHTGAVLPGVGPAMATRGSLATYLGRSLQTLRGFWPSEGEKAFRPRVLLPRMTFKAQPNPPVPGWGYGRKLRHRGLQESAAGMPAGGLCEEILTPGEGQIRALFLHSGAMLTWPQTDLTRKALESLDLLVVHDVERELSPTARAANYVIATKVQFEIPVITQFMDVLSFVNPAYGWPEPYGAYHPAILQSPPDADLLEAWQIYYRVAQKLGIQLKCGGPFDTPETAPALDMEHEPTTDDLYELMCHDSAIPLAEVKKYPGGKLFEAAAATVGPRDPDCTARLQLADTTMLGELDDIARESYTARRGTNTEFPYLFIPRRILQTLNSHAVNSACRSEGTLKHSYNPAYLHSQDLQKLDLCPGDKVEIRSRHGAIVGFVDIDDDLRPGVLSMCHGFGKHPGDNDYDPRRHGSNVNQLLHWEDDYDPYHGMPRMGAVPVTVERIGG